MFSQLPRNSMVFEFGKIWNEFIENNIVTLITTKTGNQYYILGDIITPFQTVIVDEAMDRDFRIIKDLKIVSDSIESTCRVTNDKKMRM